MPKERLTKRAVEALQAQEHDYVIWDADLRNFGVKVTPKGRKTYFVFYRTQAGTQRRPALGTHGEITAEQARDMARDWLGRARQGQDPSKDRQQLRRSMTLAQYCERFMSEHSNVKNRTATAYNYQRLIDRFLIPQLGSRKICEILRDDVARLHTSLADTPYQANRLLGLVSKIMNDAERDGHRPPHSNPCAHIKRFSERERQRFLGRSEILRLFAVLSEQDRTSSETPHVIAAFGLLLATGCRLGEILKLRWADVDTERHVINLRDSKTGPRPVSLSGLAAAILERIPRIADNPYVIVGVNPGSPLVNLQKPWRRIRKLAELDDVRLHDLRHTFASLAAAQGMSLQTIKELLGHSQIRTTLRYAHLTKDHLREASNQVGEQLAELIAPVTEAAPAGGTPKKRLQG